MFQKKILSISVISILLLSSCNFGGNQANPQQTLQKFEEQSQSAKKVLPEQYLPKSSLAVLSVSINDTETRENLDQLLKQFPGIEELKEAFWQGFRQTGNEKTADLEKMEKEFRNLLDNIERVVVGITVENDEPVLYGAWIMKSTSAMDPFITELKSKLQFSEETVNGQKIMTNTENGVSMSFKDDVLFISTKKEGLTQMLGRKADDSIYADPDFKKTLGSLEFPALAYGYVLPGEGVKILLEKAKDPKIKAAFDNDSFKMLKALGASIAAHKDGFSLRLYEEGNKEVMDQAGFKFSTIQRPGNTAWLAGQLPDSLPLLYEEAYNVKKALQTSFELSGSSMTPEVQKSLMTMKGMIESATGLDLQKDVLDLLDKRILFAMQYEKNNFMPAITILFDTAGHESSVEKIITTLDKNIDVLLSQIAQSGAPSNLLTKETVKVGNAELHRLKLNSEYLLSSPNIPPQAKEGLKNLKVEFVYGMTAQKQMILTTIGNIESSFKSQDGTTPWLKQGLDKLELSQSPDGVVYVDVANILSYVDDIVNLVNGIEPMSASDRQSYEKIINVIKPIKYMVFGSDVEDYSVTSRGFVKIGE